MAPEDFKAQLPPTINFDDAQSEVRTALGLEAGQTITDYTARQRENYDICERRLPGGALVVRCQVARGESDTSICEIEIDSDNRPLGEDLITFFGLVAESARREHPLAYIHRTYPAS